MVADTNTPTEATAETVAAQADTVAETAKDGASQGEKVAKTIAKTSARTGERTVKKVRKPAAKTRRKKAAAAKSRPAAKERNDSMKFDPTNIFAGFGAFPGATTFEKLFTEAAERSEEAAKRSRKAVEDLADIYRGNVDAFVEAGRIATAGAQSIGQDIVAKSRDSLEQTANNVRTLAEAKSATELLQLQSDFARTAFDRFVEESSALTESVVKLAGETFQPLSNRASANVERLNEIAA
jgi:phasin family protein